jgi:hypothetical protein
MIFIGVKSFHRRVPVRHRVSFRHSAGWCPMTPIECLTPGVRSRLQIMRILLIVAALSMSTPVVAQSSGDAAGAGLAGLIGMFGVFGFLLALFYSVVLFCLPFMVWGCLKRLTDIRDESRSLRRDLAAMSQKVSVAPATMVRPSPAAIVQPAPVTPVPPAPAPKWMSQNVADIKPIMRDFEEK